MKKIGFLLFKGIAFVNSITPFALLYLKSDFYFFILYYLARYRRKVVRENLVSSFPEKPLAEIKRIERRFYHDFCDLFVEGCKLMRLKPDGLSNRVTFTNPEMIQMLYEKGRSVFCAMSHSGNWEWFNKLIGLCSAHKDIAIYKKMQNPYFDAFMLNLRLKFIEEGMEMVESMDVKKKLAEVQDRRNLVLILGDQSPRGVDSDYWTEFLHRDTCWYYGLEKMAKSLDYAVVFVEMNRVRRGHYSVTFRMITETPKQTEEGFILEQYVRYIERLIQNQPENWLWSHRRWKHSRQIKQA